MHLTLQRFNFEGRIGGVMSGILDHTCTSKRARLTKKAQTLANKSEAAVFQMLLFPLSQWADK